MVELATLLDDLAAESAALDGAVAVLPPERWSLATPAPGWTIADQIAHLTWTDEVALLAATDPDGFGAVLAAAAADPTGFTGSQAARVRAEAGRAGTDPAGVAGRLLARWRTGRLALRDTLAGLPPGTGIPWFGTSMAVASMATARLMETWAHGVDVRDALGRPTEPTPRLRHVAYLGFRALGYAFAVNGLPVPEEPVHVRLSAPDGGEWTFGPAGAANAVHGRALDFCLLVTQRRHLDDLAVVASGPVARQWLGIAQAFAGPPGRGRAPAPSTDPATGEGR